MKAQAPRFQPQHLGISAWQNYETTGNPRLPQNQAFSSAVAYASDQRRVSPAPDDPSVRYLLHSPKLSVGCALHSGRLGSIDDFPKLTPLKSVSVTQIGGKRTARINPLGANSASADGGDFHFLGRLVTFRHRENLFNFCMGNWPARHSRR